VNQEILDRHRSLPQFGRAARGTWPPIARLAHRERSAERVTTRRKAALPDQQPLEVELKLAATAEAMDTLLASPLLRQHARSTVRTRQLVSIYYDTKDHRLSRKRLAFRVRQSGRGRFVQTLKSGNRAEVAGNARGEWEVDLPDGTPQLTAFADPAVLELTGLVLPDELVPIFETRFKRQALLVEWPDGDRPPARIEVAFDRGAIRADGRERPICEVELELKQGEARALFELAEAMRALAPLRLHPLDKAARGYLLVDDAPPAWHKAKPVVLTPGMLVDDALHAIFGGCMRQWLDNEAATRDARDPEGLHQLRVALRRLRSALTLFKTALAEPARRGWSDELRWLLGPLGPARDLDVFATETMAPVAAARGAGDPALTALAELVDDRRRRAHARVGEVLASERYGDFSFKLACWIARRGWRQDGADIDVLLAQRQPVPEFAAAILHRRHRRVLKRGKRFAELTPPQRHELRIALKKLRYGTEFFGSLYEGKPVERFRKAAARMQDVLGHLNDVAVAEHLVQDVLDGASTAGPPRRAAALGAGQVVGWYAHAATELEPKAVEAWEAFRAVEPFWTAASAAA
jgi:inorganic triphosphatase YgiF